MTLYLAGESGLWKLRFSSQKREIQQLLAAPISAFLAQRKRLFAATPENLFRSDDGGQSWNAVLATNVTAIAASPNNSDLILAGTQPASIFRSEDGGKHWVERSDLRQIAVQEAWWLPTPPFEPVVTDLTFNSTYPAEVWAAAEVGGAAFSPDGGQTWQLRSYGLHGEVHRILVDAKDPLRLYTATGAGFFITQSNGLNWDRVAYEMQRTYLVPLIALPPVPGALPEVMITAGARTPHAYWYGEEGALAIAYRSEDRGESWLPITDGFNLNMRAMITDFTATPAAPHDVFALASNAILWHSPDRGLHWQRVWEDLPSAWRLYLSA